MLDLEFSIRGLLLERIYRELRGPPVFEIQIIYIIFS